MGGFVHFCHKSKGFCHRGFCPRGVLSVYHYLVFTCVHVHFCISRYFPLSGIGHGLSLDRAVFPTNYRPGISRTYKPTAVHISQPMFTLVLGVSVLDVLEYLII